MAYSEWKNTSLHRPRAKRTTSGQALANDAGRAERERGWGGRQGLRATQGRGCGWQVAMRRCPCDIGLCTVGAPESRISSWQEGARMPES